MLGIGPIVVMLEGFARLTVTLHDPQCSELIYKSSHVPEQQAGTVPGHGKAVQDPQCPVSLFRLVQVPEQHMGSETLHWALLSITL